VNEPGVSPKYTAQVFIIVAVFMGLVRLSIFIIREEYDMNSYLNQILTKIVADNRDIISHDARNYKEVDMSQVAADLGLADAKDSYRHVNAIVPIKAPVEGMKVRIDGRTFVDYVQFDSGVAVPGYVAAESGLPHRAYEAWDSMILNFT
jgi:hypothetical protein